MLNTSHIFWYIFGKIKTFVFLYLERKMNIKSKIVNRIQKFYIKSSEKPNVFIYNTGKSKMLCSLAQCHQWCLFVHINIRVHSTYYNPINVLLMICHSGGMINNIDTESTKSYEINNLSNDNRWKSSRLYSLEKRRLL